MVRTGAELSHSHGHAMEVSYSLTFHCDQGQCRPIEVQWKLERLCGTVNDMNREIVFVAHHERGRPLQRPAVMLTPYSNTRRMAE